MINIHGTALSSLFGMKGNTRRESELEKEGERGREERNDAVPRGELNVIYIVADFAEGNA